MNDTAKEEAEKIWTAHKATLEMLTTAISTLYESLGSTRKCRLINQIWHSTTPAVLLGFVPPEAKEKLDTLIVVSGLHLAKGNGPLGHGSYFSLLYDAQFDAERIGRLSAAILEEAGKFKAAPPPRHEPLAAEEILAEQVHRVEGITHLSKEKIRTRPQHVAPLADAFNSSTAEMKPAKALKLLADSIPYFELPETMRNELLHTVKMMQEAEAIGHEGA